MQPHVVLFDGNFFAEAESLTAARDIARGARRGLRMNGDAYVGRVTVQSKDAKMKVYLLTFWVPYESDSPSGVFSSVDKAKAAVTKDPSVQGDYTPEWKQQGGLWVAEARYGEWQIQEWKVDE
jgi:hypothetical protein